MPNYNAVNPSDHAVVNSTFCDQYCRFNASMMLETLRGKRMMFVGDSLNRGQFVSLVCLLHQLIPEDAKSMETFDSLTVFTAKVGKVPFGLCKLQYFF